MSDGFEVVPESSTGPEAFGAGSMPDVLGHNRTGLTVQKVALAETTAIRGYHDPADVLRLATFDRNGPPPR